MEPDRHLATVAIVVHAFDPAAQPLGWLSAFLRLGVLPNLADDPALDHGCRKRSRGADLPAPLAGILADVVVVAASILLGPGGRHGAAARLTAQESLEQGARLLAYQGTVALTPEQVL